ncbi:hypothetical protein [Enterococcus sp. DIV0756]|uniref:hypothetical protein n=1 Tax=Enterococcus sp. DIV0756 TaxID=2774636 RepID=UPI003F1FCD1B
MKKLVSIISLFLVAGVLGGCGPSAQEQFKEEFKTQKEMNDQTFKVTIDKLSINPKEETSADEKLSYDVIEKQLKGLTPKANVLQDKKTKDITSTISTTLFGQELEYEIFTNNKTKDVYIKGDAYNQTIEFMKQFSDELPVDVVDSEVIQGKYILLTKEDMEDSLDEANEVTNISDKQYDEFYDSLDKNSFKKEGDTITHRFTKKELEEFVDSLSEKKDKDLRSSLEERLEQFKKLTIDLTVDTKKHTKNAKIVATSKPVDGNSYSMNVTVEQHAKNSEKRVELPPKTDIISLADFAEKAASTAIVKVSDENLNTLIEGARKNKEFIDAEAAELYKEEYRQYLNEEQYKEFSKVLDEIVAENNQ